MAQATEHCLHAKNFILTKEQLALEQYPMPGNYHNMKQKGRSRFHLCRFIKDKYKDLTSSSKMFALDCEMVENYINESEVVSICVVDEDLNVIYKTLVKPDCRIKDYRSEITGINAHTLQNVTTTLDDVQKFLSEQLPDDAILVGQSLNHDLLALKFMHPYIIDTSVVYNTSGNIKKKLKLKYLAKKYLNVTIQAGHAGAHSAEEDALTAMKLIKLRIEKGPLPGMNPYNSVKKPKKSKKSKKSKKLKDKLTYDECDSDDLEDFDYEHYDYYDKYDVCPAYNSYYDGIEDYYYHYYY